MTTVTFIEADGTRHEVQARNDRSLMQAAVQNALPGIDTDCDGKCLCATCHVILPEEWYARLGDPNPDEKVMLDPTPERAPTSRLSCQILVTEALDGLVVQLPAFQM